MDEEVKPVENNDPDACNIDGRSREHKTAWVWVGGVMTDRVRCTTCGREWVNNRDGLGAVGVTA